MTPEALRDWILKELRTGAVGELLQPETAAELRGFSNERLAAEVERFLARPIQGSAGHDSRQLLNPVLACSWLALFRQMELPTNMSVYEPCAGASEPVLLALDAYTNGAGAYTTVNLNRKLAGEFKSKLARITVHTTVIEADAACAAQLLEPRSIDCACFHHALNDLMQTAAAEQRGMDTRTIDWWPAERTMIGWMAEGFERDGGALERQAVLNSVREATALVKPGGYLMFDHFTWEAHRNAEWLPWELFTDMLPMARQWIATAGLISPR